MPIGGGTFTAQNKILPGAYINFVSLGNITRMGTRGVAALPLELNWGPEDQVFSLSSGDFTRTAQTLLGYDPTAPHLILVREALKQASRLLLYRVNSGGAKASATVGGITVTAKYGGTRGNDLSAAVFTCADNVSHVEVVTYLAGQVVDCQTVNASIGYNTLTANDFVTFQATGPLTTATITALSGGANGTVDGSSHAKALLAFEVETFQVIGYPGTVEDIKSLYAAFVKRLRDTEGRKVVGVLHQYNGDHMGLINVKNGVVLRNGTVITGDMAVAWVAGASAGAAVNKSLTNTVYDDAVDVDIKYTTAEFEAAIQTGEFVFYSDGGKARVLTDTNSLVTFGEGVSEDWTSNRVVRVMDNWANDVASIFGASYLGLVTNSDTGRELFKADLVSLALQYQSIDAISDFDSSDLTVVQGGGKRDVAVHCVLQPNDSMEKLYMIVSIS